MDKIRESVYEMRQLLDEIEIDLAKVARDNKSAARRVRTNCSAISKKAIQIRRGLLSKKD